RFFPPSEFLRIRLSLGRRVIPGLSPFELRVDARIGSSPAMAEIDGRQWVVSPWTRQDLQPNGCLLEGGRIDVWIVMVASEVIQARLSLMYGHEKHIALHAFRNQRGNLH